MENNSDKNYGWQKQFWYSAHREPISKEQKNNPATLKSITLHLLASQLLDVTKKDTDLMLFTKMAHCLPTDLLNELAAVNICINKEENTRTTLLLSAICQKNEKIVALLLEPPWSAPVNKTCCLIQHLPLHKAITMRDLGIVHYLLRRGAHLTILGKNKSTFLHLATRLGDIKIIKLLLGYGADRTAKNINDQRAYELAHNNPNFYAAVDTYQEMLDILNPEKLIAEDQLAKWRKKEF